MVKLNHYGRGGCDVLSEKKHRLAGLVVGLVLLMAAPAFARGITFKDAGVAFWIFIIIGTILILLQLIPAIVLFFSFVGTMTGSSQRRRLQKK